MPEIDSIKFRPNAPMRMPLDCPIRDAKMYAPEGISDIAKVRHTARRFYFDADASSRIGDTVQHNMKFVVDNMPGVHFPYDPLYLVLDERKVWEGRGGKPKEQDFKILSFLICNGVVRTFVGMGDDCVLDAIQFQYNKEQKPIDGVSERVLDIARMTYIYGGRISKRDKNVMLIPDIRDNSLPLAISLIGDYGVDTEDSFLNLAESYGGAPLICLAALMMLNSHHEAVTRDHVPAKRAMVHGGKSVALPEYHTVHIVQGKRAVSTRKIMATFDRRPAREHDVRGHFVHYGDDGSNCTHMWEPLDVFGKRFRCRTCGMRRTWRNDFKRGDAMLGRIEKHYEVHND